MSEQHLEEIEMNIHQAKEIVENGKALERLRANPDFQKVVLTGYLEQEAVRLVHLKGDPTMTDEASQKTIVTMIDSIGCFTSYLQNTRHQAYLAEKAIEDGEKTREELLAEGGE